MISPAKQKIIQIDITNACPHRCSNCTRFVGHHKKPFFMSHEDFAVAVDSLRDFPGMVGVMGGEPTLHPEFEEFALTLKQARPDVDNPFKLDAHEDFVSYRNETLSNVSARRGLWTSLGPGYEKHFEIIQDVFRYQCVNDHAHSGKHTALLIPRYELNIPSADWIKYRDACWVQNKWSASITPKGAFFCEVAAALDMLFDGPGGWPVEKDWWKREPVQFGDQLHWCEMCSACLPVPAREAREGVDDVSPAMHKKLKEIGSKKPMRVFNVDSYDKREYECVATYEPYLPEEGNAARVAGTNDSVKVKGVSAVVVCVDYDDYLEKTLPLNSRHFDSFTVVTDEHDYRTKDLCTRFGVEWIVSERLHENSAVFAKGKGINDGLEWLDVIGGTEWTLVMDADVILSDSFRENLLKLTLNPGALYYTRRWGPEDIDAIPPLMNALARGEDWQWIYKNFANTHQAKFTGRDGNDLEHYPFGYFQLFNRRALSLRERGREIYPENSTTAESDDLQFATSVFGLSRCASLPTPLFDVIHLPHGQYQENWTGRASPRVDVSIEQLAKITNAEYVCKKRCFFGNREYVPGEVLRGNPRKIPTSYFNRVEVS